MAGVLRAFRVGGVVFMHVCKWCRRTCVCGGLPGGVYVCAFQWAEDEASEPRDAGDARMIHMYTCTHKQQAQQADKAKERAPTSNGNGHSQNGNGEQRRQQGEAFRRVDDQYWSQAITDDRLRDNSCACALGGGWCVCDGWGLVVDWMSLHGLGRGSTVGGRWGLVGG